MILVHIVSQIPQARSSNFFDGDIYCRIRLADLQGQREEKRKWLARLSKSKQRDVIQLEGRAQGPKDPEMRDFSKELDELIPFRGLWPAFQIGTFHRLLSLRCPKVCGRRSIYYKSRLTDLSGK